MLDVVRRRWFFILLSALVIVPGLLSMAVPPAFRLGIDFTGGSALTVTFEQPVNEGDVRAVMTEQGHPDAVIQKLESNVVFIRTRELKPQVIQNGQLVRRAEREQLQEALAAKLGAITSTQFDSVSPVIAVQTVRNAIIAVVAASVGILLYITFAFRKVPKPLRYGVVTVIALIHDILVVMGITSILGKFFAFQIDAIYVVALLTVIGYSVHDSIVVLDRVRENVLRYGANRYDWVVNTSVLETMGRSINTTLTTLIVLGALWLLGGPTIRNFVITLFIGFVAGTYSSVFIAAQLLVIWEKREFGRLLGAKRPAPTPTGA